MEKLRQQIEQRLSAVMGDACFYYENLATGVCFGHAADKPVVAASVIKLAVLIEAFRQMDADAVRANEMLSLIHILLRLRLAFAKRTYYTMTPHSGHNKTAPCCGFA